MGRPSASRFQAETGIRESDWRGIHWVRWSDALKEVGLPPNRLRGKYDEAHLLEKYAVLVRELGHLPVVAEMRLKARRDKTFPNPKTFATRYGNKRTLAARLTEWWRARDGYEDVVAICEQAAPAPVPQSVESLAPMSDFGSVYLLKMGSHYKIGRTNSVGRRERELSIQLPEKATLIHTIRTDDPAGIESYWHRRFEPRRGNGEWFALTREDVSAFKRRKFM